MKQNNELRFGVAFLANASMDELLKQFNHVEKLNFDIAGTGDQLVNFFDPRKLWFELWTLTSAWAVTTKRIKIGMYVTAFPYRNPAILAKQAITVDHLSNGRLELGLGAALRSDPCYEMTGIPNWRSKERLARFREYVEIVDQLLTNEITNYDGRYYQIKEAVMSPLPVQKPRPPITIAASQPRMLNIAARYADTWTTLGSADNLEEIRNKTMLIDKYCREYGRDPGSIRRSYWFYEHGALASDGLLGCYESEDAFREMVMPFIDMGITEVLLSYPCREEQLAVFENIYSKVLDVDEDLSKFNKAPI